MSILIVAILVATAMPEAYCWPDMSNIAGLYTNKKMFRTFEELKNEDNIKSIIIGFKNYHYLDSVNVTFSRGGATVSADYRFSHEISETYFDLIEPSRYKCDRAGIGHCIMGTLGIISANAKLIDVALDGYETNLHKYVGCFKTIHFKELKPIADFLDCELTCSDTPFYGFTSVEQCVCIKSLPKTETRLDICEECDEKKAILCGTEGISVSVYSKGSVQEILEMDPSLFETCMANESDCPSCSEGRSGFMCIIRDCSVNSGSCGDKRCENLNFEDIQINLCFCAEGLYINDALECQDVDECIDGKLCNEKNRTCLNTYKSYTCKCAAGLYEVDKVTCSDVNECETETSCDLSTTTCKNLYGDYECVCLEGYVKMDPKSRNASCEVPVDPVLDMMMTLMMIILSVLGVIAIIIVWRFVLFRSKPE